MRGIIRLIRRRRATMNGNNRRIFDFLTFLIRSGKKLSTQYEYSIEDK
jgi:hypothetical protein